MGPRTCMVFKSHLLPLTELFLIQSAQLCSTWLLLYQTICELEPELCTLSSVEAFDAKPSLESKWDLF